MTKLRPLACPVAGCPKRGKEGDLMRHARSKHPQLKPEAYQALLRGSARPGTRAYRRSRWRQLGWAVAILAAGVILGYVTFTSFQ